MSGCARHGWLRLDFHFFFLTVCVTLGIACFDDLRVMSVIISFEYYGNFRKDRSFTANFSNRVLEKHTLETREFGAGWGISLEVGFLDSLWT